MDDFNAAAYDEWRLRIEKDLERIGDLQQQIHDDMEEIKKFRTDVLVEIGKLTVKSSVWGLLGDLIPAIAVALYVLIKLV